MSADLKTLRLASLQLSPERLDAFMTYQRTLLAELHAATAPDWSGKYAFAHGKALAASKLDLVEMGKLKALIAEFCGKRSAVQVVKERMGQAAPQAAERAKKELPKLEDLKPFRDRYGEEATDLLMSREAELLQLHRDLAKAEGTGHLHPRASPS